MPQQIISQLKRNGSPLEQIAEVQMPFAQLFEFENLDVLLENEEPITEQFLIGKMAEGGKGGVCYELNGLLHVVLKKLGFDVAFAVATVWDGNDWILDKTHTINLYNHEGTLYLLDSGSGNNLSMAPIALDGDTIESSAGTYQLRTQDTERGSIVCECLTDEGWVLRYAFHPHIVGWDDLNRVKKLIHTHPDSPFNKTLLVAKTMPDGTFPINEERYFRKWTDGRAETARFETRSDMLDAVKEHAAPAVHEAAVRLFD